MVMTEVYSEEWCHYGGRKCLRAAERAPILAVSALARRLEETWLEGSRRRGQLVLSKARKDPVD